ncbi:MAG: glycoside hydrolase family 9 protein [Lachnospiraceae bacterium]|nr:glycoside hydrolase family 9 protein [Lachnospiraceae bacterium]
MPETTMQVLNPIRIDQNGYSTHLPKYIAVLKNEPVSLYTPAGDLVRKYEDPGLSFDEASGDDLAIIDLGDIPAGSYTVKCGDHSADISVRDKAFSELAISLTKALYYQRCGCALDSRYAGIFTHKACHTAPAAEWENKSIKKTIIGGWHDAGDFGKYVSPGAVTVAHMLYAYLLFPTGCSDDINIPETGNGTPDILNEARWELEWIIKMQREDGAFYHKLTKDHFAPFIMPEDDLDLEYLIPPTHCATADAVAVLALASRIYRKFDPAFSDKALSSALAGWDWLVKNQEFVPYMNPEGVRTGPYGDARVSDELFWTCCELYAAASDENMKNLDELSGLALKFSKEAEYIYKWAKDEDSEPDAECIFKPMIEKEKEAAAIAREKFKMWKLPKLAGLNLTQFGWSDVSGLGALCCLFVLKEKAGNVLYDELKADFLKRSETALERVNASVYRTALKPDEYVWGSILSIMNNAMTMTANHLITGSLQMRNGALSQLDYSLGLNALDLSFVTGFGTRSVQNPHHRPSGADGIGAPVPGFIVGGPNKRWTYPETKERLGESTPAAKYYLDETPSADTNEVAIYWNSPVIFVTAFFNSL